MTRNDLLEFLRKHQLGVLATVTPAGEPESAVVGVAFTDRLEIIFDTLGNTRKVQNLRKNPKIAFVVGWDEEITVQLEGIADEQFIRMAVSAKNGRASPIFTCALTGRGTAISTGREKSRNSTPAN